MLLRFTKQCFVSKMIEIELLARLQRHTKESLYIKFYGGYFFKILYENGIVH